MDPRRTAALSFSLMGGTFYYVHSNTPFAPHTVAATVEEATALLPDHAHDIKKFGVRVMLAGSVIRISPDCINAIVARVRSGETLELASANVRAALTLGGLTWLVAVRRARGVLEGEGDL